MRVEDIRPPTFYERWQMVKRRDRYTLRNVLEDLRFLLRG